MISAADFQRLADEGFNRIPVVREVLSDLDTPLSVYLKLADGPHTFLFESVEGGETWGRYSIIGLPARRVYTFRGHTLTIAEHGQVVETREVADPFAEVEALRSAHSVPKLDGLPGFTGGLVGWFGFECIGYIEPRLAPPAGPAARAGPAGEPLGVDLAPDGTVSQFEHPFAARGLIAAREARLHGVHPPLCAKALQLPFELFQFHVSSLKVIQADPALPMACAVQSMKVPSACNAAWRFSHR